VRRHGKRLADLSDRDFAEMEQRHDDRLLAEYLDEYTPDERDER